MVEIKRLFGLCDLCEEEYCMTLSVMESHFPSTLIHPEQSLVVLCLALFIAVLNDPQEALN